MMALEDIDLNFLPPYLVGFSIPIRPEKVLVQKKNHSPEEKFQSKLVLKNGDYVLKLIADPDIGHPYGKDRILLAWIFTQVVKTQKKYVDYKSIRWLLDQLGLPYSRQNRNWLYEATVRLSNCFLQYSKTSGMIVETTNGHVLSRTAGPLDPKREESVNFLAPSGGVTNFYFEISEHLYQNILECSLPLDIRVVRALGDNYGAIDLYLFWSWRNFRMHGSKEDLVSIQLKDLKMHMNGAEDPYRFSQQMKERIKSVRKAVSLVNKVDDAFNVDIYRGKLIIKRTYLLIPSSKLANLKMVSLEPTLSTEKASESDEDMNKNAQHFAHIKKLLKGSNNLS